MGADPREPRRRRFLDRISGPRLRGPVARRTRRRGPRGRPRQIARPRRLPHLRVCLRQLLRRPRSEGRARRCLSCRRRPGSNRCHQPPLLEGHARQRSRDPRPQSPGRRHRVAGHRRADAGLHGNESRTARRSLHAAADVLRRASRVFAHEFALHQLRIARTPAPRRRARSGACRERRRPAPPRNRRGRSGSRTEDADQRVRRGRPLAEAGIEHGDAGDYRVAGPDRGGQPIQSAAGGKREPPTRDGRAAGASARAISIWRASTWRKRSCSAARPRASDCFLRDG